MLSRALFNVAAVAAIAFIAASVAVGLKEAVCELMDECGLLIPVRLFLQGT